MGFQLTYAAEVYDDLQENIEWYSKKRPGLGSRFFKAVKEQIARIKKSPYTIAVRYEDVRCAKVKGFSYNKTPVSPGSDLSLNIGIPIFIDF